MCKTNVIYLYLENPQSLNDHNHNPYITKTYEKIYIYRIFKTNKYIISNRSVF